MNYYINGTQITPEELQEFIDYVYSFYNVVDGLYPVYGCTKNKIKLATYEYLGPVSYTHLTLPTTPYV